MTKTWIGRLLGFPPPVGKVGTGALFATKRISCQVYRKHRNVNKSEVFHFNSWSQFGATVEPLPFREQYSGVTLRSRKHCLKWVCLLACRTKQTLKVWTMRILDSLTFCNIRQYCLLKWAFNHSGTSGVPLAQDIEHSLSVKCVFILCYEQAVFKAQTVCEGFHHW